MDEIFDKLADDLSDASYAVCDNFISAASVELLLKNGASALNNGEFKEAGIGRTAQHQTNKAVRSDQVMWLTGSTIKQWCPELSDRLTGLTLFLNQSCYAGINQSEFHLAHYGKGAFYKRHLDQFKDNGDRRFTVIVYLNPDWEKSNGGQLVVYGNGGPVEIEPLAGRLVFFESGHLEHEVLAANRSRWSFTGWLKSVRLPESPCSTNY